MDFLTHPIDTTPALYTHVDPYLEDVLLMTIDELKAESAELDRLCWTEEVYSDKPRLETLKKRRQIVERRTRQLIYKVEPIIRDPKRRARFEYDVLTRNQIMQRFPNIVAHIICESLGYATPSHAAGILQTALLGDPDYCEWIDACYHNDGTRAVQGAIERRHRHHGYMASFQQARLLVEHAIQDHQEPVFASWF